MLQNTEPIFQWKECKSIYENVSFNILFTLFGVKEKQIYQWAKRTRKIISIFHCFHDSKASFPLQGLSQLYCFCGNIESFLDINYNSHFRLSKSINYNNKNMIAHRSLLKIYIKELAFNKCLKHIEKYRKYFVNPDQFFAVQALALCLSKNYTQKGRQKLQKLHYEISKNEQKYRQYFYCNLCLGCYYYHLMYINDAYEFFKRQHQLSPDDANAVSFMLMASYKANKYKRALNQFYHLRSLVNKPTESVWAVLIAIVCCIKLQRHKAKDALLNKLDKLMNLRYHTLLEEAFYCGVLYHLGQYEKAIKRYDESNVVLTAHYPQSIQSNLVAMLCYQKMKNIEQTELHVRHNLYLFKDIGKIPLFMNHLHLKQLQFIMAYLFERGEIAEGKEFRGLMGQFMKQFRKGFVNRKMPLIIQGMKQMDNIQIQLAYL